MFEVAANETGYIVFVKKQPTIKQQLVIDYYKLFDLVV